MIFITVGNTDPFDRLIQAVEKWALTQSPQQEIFAQIGKGTFLPTAFPSERFLDPLAFESRFEDAELVVSHAGMGTIITALEMGKPLLVMPKRASLGEQRNEHQLATVEHVCRKYSVCVANDEHEFSSTVNRLLKTIREHENGVQERTDRGVSASLLEFVQGFVHQKDVVPVLGGTELN